MSAEHSSHRLREHWPLLYVSDLERSLEFYTAGLGFQLRAEARTPAGERYWCRVQRESVSLMLQQADAEELAQRPWGQGVVFYVICDDARTIHRELQERGLNPGPPNVTAYGMCQVFVPEPDGYALCFESLAENGSASL